MFRDDAFAGCRMQMAKSERKQANTPAPSSSRIATGSRQACLAEGIVVNPVRCFLGLKTSRHLPVGICVMVLLVLCSLVESSVALTNQISDL